MRIVTLRDEDARSHRGPAVTAIGTMSVDFAAMPDRFEGGLRAAHQFLYRDREEGAIDRAEPEGMDGLMMQIRSGRKRKAHIDDEPHAEFAQPLVIAEGRHTADEEVIGDLREVHARIVSQD